MGLPLMCFMFVLAGISLPAFILGFYGEIIDNHNIANTIFLSLICIVPHIYLFICIIIYPFRFGIWKKMFIEIKDHEMIFPNRRAALSIFERVERKVRLSDIRTISVKGVDLMGRKTRRMEVHFRKGTSIFYMPNNLKSSDEFDGLISDVKKTGVQFNSD